MSATDTVDYVVKSLLEAIAAGKADSVATLSDTLSDRISKGEYPTLVTDLVDELGVELHHWSADSLFADDESFDFRLVIRPDGTTELLTGDPQYDTDHRGYWGYQSAHRNDTDDDLRDAICDAVEACVYDFFNSI